VLVDAIRFRTPLPDVACGTAELESGEASFLGRAWQRYYPSSAARHRGMIGRVFSIHPWVSNLDVDENILLPHLHHRHGSGHDLRTEAIKLAKHFGLDDLPGTRPVSTRPDDLKRAALVRAFLGKPTLLVLERPTYGIYPDLMPPLLTAIADAGARGAAVLWLDNFPEALDHPDLKPAARYKMNGPRLEEQTR
jgi:phospholipid/cholesterol/gamma-HCH transport system ATP-binding protein